MDNSPEEGVGDISGDSVVRYPLMFDHRHYVPRVLWKQGEYQALLYLRAHTKTDVTPLIDIPEIGFDFEKGEEAKTIDQHLDKFGKRLVDKWGKTWAFVDVGLIDKNERMQDGRHPLKFVFDDIRLKNGLAIPVIRLERDSAYQAAVLETIQTDRSGVCIRLTIDDFVSGS